jgi:hypothetical protein
MLAGGIVPMFAAVYWKSCKPLAAVLSIFAGSMTRLARGYLGRTTASSRPSMLLPCEPFVVPPLTRRSMHTHSAAEPRLHTLSDAIWTHTLTAAPPLPHSAG